MRKTQVTKIKSYASQFINNGLSTVGLGPYDRAYCIRFIMQGATFAKPSRQLPSPAPKPTVQPQIWQAILLRRRNSAPCAHMEIKRKNFGICFLTLKNPAVA